MKAIIASMLALALVLSAVGIVAMESDAEGETYTVEYSVGAMTYTDTTDSPSYKLKTMEAIGASVPAGKEFAGWATDGSVVYVAGSTVTLSAASTTFTATFNDIEYTAQFIVDDEVIFTDVGTYGQLPDVPEAPVLEGYIFEGWNDGAKTYAPAEVPVFSADATYAAEYSIDYDLTFKVDGIVVLTTTISEFEGVSTPAKEGYSFVAWFDGSVAVLPEELAEYIDDAVDGDTVFIAGWEAARLTVKFMAGDELVTTETVLYGDLAVEPKLPKGYVAWAWDFKNPVTEDMTIKATEAPAPAPSGLKDPMIQIAIVLGATLALIIVAFLVLLNRRGKLKMPGKKPKEGAE